MWQKRQKRVFPQFRHFHPATFPLAFHPQLMHTHSMETACAIFVNTVCILSLAFVVGFIAYTGLNSSIRHDHPIGSWVALALVIVIAAVCWAVKLEAI